MTEWVKFSDGKPSMHDADVLCNLWVSGVAVNTGNRLVMLKSYREALEMHEAGFIDYWADTGLTTPDAPNLEAI